MNVFILKSNSLKANEIINYVNTKRGNTKSIVIYRILNFLVEKKFYIKYNHRIFLFYVLVIYAVRIMIIKFSYPVKIVNKLKK